MATTKGKRTSRPIPPPPTITEEQLHAKGQLRKALISATNILSAGRTITPEIYAAAMELARVVTTPDTLKETITPEKERCAAIERCATICQSMRQATPTTGKRVSLALHALLEPL